MTEQSTEKLYLLFGFDVDGDPAWGAISDENAESGKWDKSADWEDLPNWSPDYEGPFRICIEIPILKRNHRPMQTLTIEAREDEAEIRPFDDVKISRIP